MGDAGIYLAPKFRDAVAWATSFVMHKKRDLHTRNRSTRMDDEGKGYPEKDYYYRNLTIYEVEMPKELADSCWRNNTWEQEIFVPQDLMPQLRIVKSRTWDVQDLFNLYKRQRDINNTMAGDDHSLVNRVAKTNVAAQAYKRYHDEYANLRLRKNIQIYDARIRGLLRSLYQMCIDWTTNRPGVTLNPQRQSDYEKTVRELEALMQVVRK